MTREDAFAHQEIFTTARLRLRPLRMADAEALSAIKSDPEVTGPYGGEPHLSLGETEAWVQQRIVDSERYTGLVWALTLKDEDVVVGSCCFWHFDVDFSCAEIGFELGRAYWRKGMMSEALPPVIGHGFYGLGLHRIEACTLTDNSPSRNLLLKLGFRHEANLRERQLFHGRFEDQAYYGLLRDEWTASRPSPALQDR